MGFLWYGNSQDAARTGSMFIEDGMLELVPFASMPPRCKSLLKARATTIQPHALNGPGSYGVACCTFKLVWLV